MLNNIYALIGPKRKTKLVLLIISMAIGAMLEMLSVSAVATACASLISGNKRVDLPHGYLSSRSLLVVLAALYLCKPLYLLLQNRVQARFVCDVQHQVSATLYDRTLHMPYSWFMRTNAAEIISVLGMDTGRAAEYLDAFLSMAAEVPILALISVLLFCINPVMTLFLLTGAMLSLLLMCGVIRPLASRAGRERQLANVQRTKWMTQGIHGIKATKVEQAEAQFSAWYRQADKKTADCDAIRRTLNKISGLCVESVMVVCVVLYLLWLLLTGADMITHIPSLSALVAAALRLLPSIQRISRSWVLMAGARSSAETVISILLKRPPEQDIPQISQCAIPLTKGIKASHITFYYEGRPEPILSDITVEIPAGSSTGIIGPSGNGKTTLADLLLGLLEPQEGRVTVDGVDMQKCHSDYLHQAAYIPQNIFLLDDTIRNNVTYCTSAGTVDDTAIWTALKKASLSDFVQTLPDGLDTLVGENGICLSGGERQRLGIARALYKGAKLLVFDEATSALDPKTEAAVIRSIQGLHGERTMVIISHRASAVAWCDRIYRVEHGHVKLIGPKEETK